MDRFLTLLPQSGSLHAEDVDRLFLFALAIAAFFSLFIASLIVIFSIRYRRRLPHETGSHVVTRISLEATWMAIPFLLAMLLFVWGAKLFVAVMTPPSEAMEVFVTGKQWMWKIQYPSGKREIDRLYVPRGQPVRLTMTSEDVIHSFFVPAFRSKMDVLPDRYTSYWFTPTKVGEFHLFCAEYCGTMHSLMKGKIIVLEPWEFQGWLEGGSGRGVSSESMASNGGKHFARHGCKICHEGRDLQGPHLAGLAGSRVRLRDGRTVVADASYLRESMLEPNAKIVAGYEAVMPTYRGRLSGEQLNELVEFMKSMDPRKDGR